MIHLFFNALAASAGAGLTYVRNIVPEISAREDIRATIALTPSLRQEFSEIANVTFVELDSPGTVTRFWREQRWLPRVIQQVKADVLISTGNFALRKSPIPQILLSGNSLYTSSDFYRDVLARRDYGAWLDTRVKAVFAKHSVLWADRTVAPSRAFAATLQEWVGRDVTSIYHGFNREEFFQDVSALAAGQQTKIDAAEGALKLLFVSHYNYYRNFETLLRSVPLLRDRLKARKIRLFLTCKFKASETSGSYRTGTVARLVKDHDITDEVVELGAVPYRLLHHLYRSADIYVTPAYAETFAHPLVEAMASGLPIVASDTAVHREICGRSALYFNRFSSQELAERVQNLVSTPDLAISLLSQGNLRSRDFSWKKHLEKLVAVAYSLASNLN